MKRLTIAPFIVFFLIIGLTILMAGYIYLNRTEETPPVAEENPIVIDNSNVSIDEYPEQVPDLDYPNVYMDYNDNEITGHYENGDAYIDVLLLEGDQIQFQGMAFWLNSLNENVHTGEIADIVDLEEGLKAHYSDEYGCEVSMVFKDETIDVTDNYMCGGMNVTFEGRYQKTDKDIENWDIYDSLHEF